MTEAHSLKQSLTLTKQLAKPVSGNSSKMQIITQYMCRYCGQQFNSPTVMQLHVQDHVQGKTAHQCSVCGKEFRTPSMLQRHVRVHSGERPYACSVCGRRFIRNDHVKQHMKVHFQPKDMNVCHLCNDIATKFNRHQALHAHLQKQHLIAQVFSCNRCGEAYESWEEMQSHKLAHDSILKSMKYDRTVVSNGVAKFSLGPQKIDQSPSKDDIVKTESIEVMPNGTGFLKIPSKTFYLQSGLDSMSTVSSKRTSGGGIENNVKGQDNADLERQIQEELQKFKGGKYQDQVVIKEEEKAKIAEWFTIKSDNSISKEAEVKEFKNKETTTMVAEDGMKMFTLPRNVDHDDEACRSSTKRRYPKDMNVCHLCNDMKFNRRQALHAHLQQQHLIAQVFSCHRCGEAYESREEMQSHKLTHDSILNSMKDDSTVVSNGVAKFSLGPQKIDQSPSKDDIVKTEPIEEMPNGTGFLKIPSKTFYLQSGLDSMSTVSSKPTSGGGIEINVKGQDNADLERQIQEELQKFKEGKYQDQVVIKEEEKAKIAEWFTIKSDNSISKEAEVQEFKNKETTTMVPEDGMKMFILPTHVDDDDEASRSSTKRSFSDVGDDDDDEDDLADEDS